MAQNNIRKIASIRPLARFAGVSPRDLLFTIGPLVLLTAVVIGAAYWFLRPAPPDVVEKLKRSFRYLLQSKLNTTRALQQIERDRSLACAEVQYLLEFIRSSQRGVILRRASRRAEEVLAEE